MKKLATLSFVSLFFLAGCSSSPKAPVWPPYDIVVDYDFDQNRPQYNKHVHYGYVKEIVRVQLDGSIPTGTVLSSLVDLPTSNQRQVWRDVVNVILPGGATLTIVQDHNSRFTEGQEVKIMGTGTSGRVLVDPRVIN